jgi:hypothetical protein
MTSITEGYTARAKRDLFKLLDAFPEDAFLLHAAFAGDAINGSLASSIHFRYSSGGDDSCSCAIGTIAEGTGLKWEKIAERLGRPGRFALDTLPDLEQFIVGIRPDQGQFRTMLVTRWIEDWMRQRDLTAE